MLNFEKIDEKIIKRNRFEILSQQKQKKSSKNDLIISKSRQSKKCFNNTNTHRKCEISRMIVEKKNEKTISFLFTCEKGNPSKKIFLSPWGKGNWMFFFSQWEVRREFLLFPQKITDFAHFSRQKFIFSWFFFMWEGKSLKKFSFFMRKELLKKIFFSRDAKCKISHLFSFLRDHLEN